MAHYQRRMRLAVLRVLCGAIDFIIVMLPIQLVMIGVFGIPQAQYDFLFKALFAVYNCLLLEYLGGQTLGKCFGKITVIDKDMAKLSLMHGGLRELTKVMYLIPAAGWALGIVSLIMMFTRTDGKALHDLTGNSIVLFCHEYKPEVEHD